MTLPSIPRSNIQENTTGGSFERGKQYAADGAVRSIKKTDEHTVQAQVQGSDVHPYVVSIQFDANSVREVECTCPYVEGSWCKHIVAVLFELRDDEEVSAEEAVEVGELVEDLDRAALITLIERLAEHDPRLIDQIERECSRLTGSP